MSKPKLLILSDLWGFKNCNWIAAYTVSLTPYFDLVLLDIHKLADVPEEFSTQKDIHDYLIKEGITKAVIRLQSEKTNWILGFSIGGFISWEAVLNGLKCDGLCAVSSTRLRKQIHKPDSELRLYFSSEDSYSPSKAWFIHHNIKATFFDRTSHEFYTESAYIQKICTDLKTISYRYSKTP